MEYTCITLFYHMKTFKNDLEFTYNMKEISYEQIFDLLRREKSREDLQPIEKTFFSDLSQLLSIKEQKIAIEAAQKSLVSNVSFEKEKIEFKNINKLINELIDRRQKKIILLALSRARIPSTIVNHESFSKEEDGFFNQCVSILREFKENIFKVSSDIIQEEIVLEKDEDITEPELETETNIPTDNTPKEETSEKVEEPTIEQDSKIEEEKTTTNVKFLTEIPKFYTPNKEILGPYQIGDVAELPNIIVDILIKKGRAEKIE